MPRFKVAHIREQEVDLIIVPLDDKFDYKTQNQQNAIISEIQANSSSAGLVGTVVPVWRSGSTMKFIAPQQWHSYFRSIDLSFVLANINREIFW